MREPIVVAEVKVSLRMEQDQLPKRDRCRVAAVLSFNETVVGGCLIEVLLKQSWLYCAGRGGGNVD